jgi:hypothetical protein
MKNAAPRPGHDVAMLIIFFGARQLRDVLRTRRVAQRLVRGASPMSAGRRHPVAPMT